MGHVCVFIKLHLTAQPGPVKLSSNATVMDPPYGGSVVRTATLCVCLCVFIKSDVTTHSGHAILSSL